MNSIEYYCIHTYTDIDYAKRHECKYIYIYIYIILILGNKIILSLLLEGSYTLAAIQLSV